MPDIKYENRYVISITDVTDEELRALQNILRTDRMRIDAYSYKKASPLKAMGRVFLSIANYILPAAAALLCSPFELFNVWTEYTAFVFALLALWDALFDLPNTYAFGMKIRVSTQLIMFMLMIFSFRIIPADAIRAVAASLSALIVIASYFWRMYKLMKPMPVWTARKRAR